MQHGNALGPGLTLNRGGDWVRSATVLDRSDFRTGARFEFFARWINRALPRPGRSMPLGFQCLHPEGMAENSPRFQPRVNECETISSPGGREEFVSKRSVAPSRAWSVRCTSIPPINR
jgi:hypothetical protein